MGTNFSRDTTLNRPPPPVALTIRHPLYVRLRFCSLIVKLYSHRIRCCAMPCGAAAQRTTSGVHEALG